MAWGRGGYNDLDDLDDYSTFRKAQRISSYAAEDGDIISSASRRQDQRLLNDITSRLHGLEMDSVKPGHDVAMQTGFRRVMYQKQHPLEEKSRSRRRRRAVSEQPDFKFPSPYDDEETSSKYVYKTRRAATPDGSSMALTTYSPPPAPVQVKSSSVGVGASLRSRSVGHAPSYDYSSEHHDPDWSSLRAEGQADPYLQLRVLQAKERGVIPRSTKDGYEGAFKIESFLPYASRYGGLDGDDIGYAPSVGNKYLDDVALPSTRYISTYGTYVPSESLYATNNNVPSGSVSDIYYGRYVPEAETNYFDDYYPPRPYVRATAVSKGDLDDYADYDNVVADKFRWARSGCSLSAPPRSLALQVNAPFSQPVQAPRSHRKPPLPPTVSAHKVVVPGRPATTYTVGAGYRSASVPPRDPILDSEVEEFMLGPSKPIRSARASSVAPRGSYETQRSSYRAASEPPLPPTADLAVRQAKRYLNKVETELGVGSIGGVDPYGVDDVPIISRTVTSAGGPYYAYAPPLLNYHYNSFESAPFVPSAATRYFKDRRREIFDEPNHIILVRGRGASKSIPVRGHRRPRASSLPPRYTRRDQEVDDYLMGLNTRQRFYDDTYLYDAPRHHPYVRPYHPYPAPERLAYTPVRYDTDYAYEYSHVPLRAHHPVMPTRTTSVGGHARVRLGSLPPPSPTFSRRSVPRDYDLEVLPFDTRKISYDNVDNDVDDMDRLDTFSVPSAPPKISYSELRHQANSARNKMDQHKVLLDRYLPIYMGPENEVEYEVDYKFGELADRMPQLDPYRPPMPYHPPEPAYKPATRSGGVLGKPPSGYGQFRPKMSDTRRRIREVICATRRDPTYYD